MRLTFRDGVALEEPSALSALAGDSGLGGERLAAEVGATAVKDAVRARTAEAVSRGVVGVPSVVVDGRVFWGDDRLGDAAVAARSD